MLLAGMRKLCRFCLAAVLATALCVLTLVDMPPQLPESTTDPPSIPEREQTGTRSIVAYSWARRLALDYRPSWKCQKDKNVIMGDEKFVKSSERRESARMGKRETRRRIDDNERSKKWLETVPRRLFLYSAHLDIRVTGYPSVRVIGVKRETPPTLLSANGTLYCTIWDEEANGRTTSFSMEALVSNIWLDEWGGSRDDYTGILVTCQLPRTNGNLRVHVGSKSCYQNPSHSLLVPKPRENNNGGQSDPKNRRFTVCVKGLDFDEDISSKIVTFIELNRILGAEMIYIYVFKVHDNVNRVLRMYEKSNVVRWFKLELPGDLPNETTSRRRLFVKDIWMKRRLELVPYNHCFYDNINDSDFVVPIDIDETIVPTRRDNWDELLSDVRTRLAGNFDDFASYAVRNVYFFTELQNDRPIAVLKTPNQHLVDDGPKTRGNKELTRIFASSYLDNVRTSMVSPIGDSVKSFVSTKRALTVHNHYALRTLDPSTRRAYHLDPRDALKHHHRMCDSRHLDCDLMMEDPVIDETALRYAKELAMRVKQFYATFDSR